MHRNSRIAGIAIAFTLLVCIAAEWSTGQRGIDENLADIVGSKVKSKEKIAAKNVGKTRRIYAQAHPDNREAYENIRQTHRARLVSLAPLQKVYHERAVAAAKPFKRGGKALPPKTTEIVKEFVKTPWQDVNLVFKNPRHEAVPNLQVVVTVHRKSAKHRNALEDIIWPAPNGGRLVTDPQGLIKLEKVGPLPVSIDVAFAGEDEKDWQITRSQDASLSIDQGTGTPRDMPGKPIAIYSRHSPDMLQARET